MVSMHFNHKKNSRFTIIYLHYAFKDLYAIAYNTINQYYCICRPFIVLFVVNHHKYSELRGYIAIKIFNIAQFPKRMKNLMNMKHKLVGEKGR